MALEEFVAQLEPNQKVSIAIDLLEKCLPIWKGYCRNRNIHYVDSVVGMSHSISKSLISRVVKIAKKGKTKEINEVVEEFRDPIVAMQDFDFEPPKEVELCFYSAYNLVEHFNGKEQSGFGHEIIYVSINQSIDALQTADILTSEQIKAILYQFD